MKKVDAHVIQPEEYVEAPELTDAQLAAAVVTEGGRPVNRGGRPKSPRPKQAVSLRLSQDVLDYFRSTGTGWQTRINTVLERETASGRAREGRRAQSTRAPNRPKRRAGRKTP